jgi:outer membrane protein OmpA-like peptidoglycan-associated protein
MLKRVLKIGMLASFMMCTFGAFAQEEQAQPQAENQYPNYGFWSNWSVGLKGGMTVAADGLGVQQGFNENDPNYDNSLGWALDLYLSKELNYVWDLRLQGGLHSIHNGQGKTLNLAVGFTFSFIDAIKGYNPERTLRIYAIGNAGMGIDKSGIIANNPAYGRLYYFASGGFGGSWRFAEDWTLTLEGVVCAPADLGNPIGNFKGYYGEATLGLAYNFGVTATDKARLEQESQLTQENFDALTQERDQAKAELASMKQSERTLQEKVATLEKAQTTNEKVVKNEKELAKLKAQIEQMKKEQLTFYALPLSILYGVDQSTVPAGEMNKMKAIAKVMKDNPDYKFTIVGFADYTGSADYNQKLSVKRAEEAKKVLVNKYGIDPDRLVVAGKGQAESFGDVKMSVNRRVSFYRVIE